MSVNKHIILGSSLPDDPSQPPYTDEGGSQINLGSKLSVILDWISCTFKVSEKTLSKSSSYDVLGLKTYIEQIANSVGDEVCWEQEPPKGRPGYNARVSLASGGSVHWHRTNPHQGVLFEWSGSPLTYLRDKSSDIAILAALNGLSARFTRLDVAFDHYSPVLPDIPSLRTKLKTRLKYDGGVVKPSYHPSGINYDRHTAYFGSGQSARRIRVYEKSGQVQDWRHGYWVRVELTVRKPFTEGLISAVLNSNSLAVAGRSVLSQLVQSCDLDWWSDIMTGPVVLIEPVGRKDTDRRTWLFKTVLPLLEEQLWLDALEGDNLLYDALNKLIESAPRGEVLSSTYLGLRPVPDQ